MSVAASNAVLEMSDSRHGETRVEIVEPSHEEMNSTVNDAAVVTGDFLWSRSMLRGLRSDSAVPSVAVLSTMTPRMQSFYVQQSKVLDSFAEVERLSDESTSDAESLILTRGNATRSHGTQVYSQLPEQQEEDATLGVSPHCQQVPPVRFQLSVAQATYASMLVNILLFALKLVALVMSGSLSVLSSVVDSALDLFTGVVLFVTQRLLRPKSTDFYKYPAGKQRIEPIAIIICACVMGTASLQLITQAVQSIAKGDAKPNVSGLPGAILGLSVVFKLALYLLCRRVNNPSVQALAVDHRNDTLSNLVAIIFGLMGTYVRSWIDPLGGILIAFYIIVNWVKAGREQVELLVGKAADAGVLKQLTFAALQHSQQVTEIDTVRAYHFGTNYIVEVHVVLPAVMPLREAHDIGESLQMKLEKLEHVERAFVHLDFESRHHPSTEHRS